MAIKFFLINTSVKLPDRKKLKMFIKELFLKEQAQLNSLIYIFCSDDYLLSINKEFLNHDDYTDVISFNLAEPHEPIMGEIYISLDRVKENSKLLGVSFNKEVHRVMFHGALHLCGHKDKSFKKKNSMTAAEDRYLQLYFG